MMREFGRLKRLPLVPFGEQHGGHGRRLPHANRHDIRPDEGHRVQNRQSGGDGTARRVDVNGDILFRIFRFQEEQLGDDQIRHLVIDGSPQENDVLFQQPGIDVVRAFPPGSLFDHHGDKD